MIQDGSGLGIVLLVGGVVRDHIKFLEDLVDEIWVEFLFSDDFDDLVEPVDRKSALIIVALSMFVFQHVVVFSIFVSEGIEDFHPYFFFFVGGVGEDEVMEVVGLEYSL